MNRIILTIIFSFITNQSFAKEGCFHSVVGLNGAKNIMTICFINEETARLEMIYLNDIERKDDQAICVSKAYYKEANSKESFDLHSTLGECDNGRIMAEFEFSCKKINPKLYACDEENIKERFYFSKQL